MPQWSARRGAGAPAVLIAALLAAGCSEPTDASPPAPAITEEALTEEAVADSRPPPEPEAPPAPAPTPVSTTEPSSQPQQVRYRVEIRTSDAATAGFAERVGDVLADPRGWVRAGFSFVEDPDAEYLIVLAEGPEVDELCLPMQTWSTYSCQNGPVVALNADRWRSGTPQWTGDLEAYRVMLVNHEVGHLLHLHHPTVQCPAPGLPAPVMAQQSTELGACRPNPWPLQWEIDLAAERREPLAPPPDHDTSDHRPTPPPVER
jgi:hypothetical protein